MYFSKESTSVLHIGVDDDWLAKAHCHSPGTPPTRTSTRRQSPNRFPQRLHPVSHSETDSLGSAHDSALFEAVRGQPTRVGSCQKLEIAHSKVPETSRRLSDYHKIL